MRKPTWPPKPAWLRVAPVPADRRALRVKGTPAGDVALEVWSPVGATGSLPLLVAHDGPEVDELGGLTHFVGAMIAKRRLPPTRVALLEPGERSARYSADPAYAEALCGYVVPRLLDAAPSPRAPVLMGVSLGALAALHAEWTNPGTFAGLFLASGSFFTPDLDPQESGYEYWDRVTAFTRSVLTADVAPSRPLVSVVFGSAEENAANNRRLADHLTTLGLDVGRGTVRAGHTYAGWRALLDPHLTDLLNGVRA